MWWILYWILSQDSSYIRLVHRSNWLHFMIITCAKATRQHNGWWCLLHSMLCHCILFICIVVIYLVFFLRMFRFSFSHSLNCDREDNDRHIWVTMEIEICEIQCAIKAVVISSPSFQHKFNPNYVTQSDFLSLSVEISLWNLHLHAIVWKNANDFKNRINKFDTECTVYKRHRAAYPWND